MPEKLLTATSANQSVATVEDAWKKLVKTKNVDAYALRPEISSSWKRCLEFDVHPYHSMAAALATEAVIEENRLLSSVAGKHMQILYSLLQGHGYLVMLYSTDGYILSLLGDRKTMVQAERHDVFLGANNGEKHIGTCAPSICLAEKKAVQVHWHEHFREAYHNWSCSAAPIFNHKGEVVGVLDITSVDNQFHSAKMLDLVALSAEAIGAEVNYQLLKTDSQKLYLQFSSLLDNTSEALLVFDHNDTLTHLSGKAQELLKTKAPDIVGHNANNLISNYKSAKSGLEAGRQLTELNFFTSSNTAIVVEAHLKPISADNSANQAGLIGILTPKKHQRAHNHFARYHFQDLIYKSDLMATIIDEAKAMAQTEHTILIQGESGTGKEILAQAIHSASGLRGAGPFIAINCAALPKDLIQAELFGYEGGAFTGASKSGQAGKFEQADGGTIFLDEIGDMPADAQASLLRVLQEKNIVRIGGGRVRQLNTRVIAATNKELTNEVKEGRFRKDLYYRLSVISLSLPPLRDRREDIWPLMAHLVDKNSHGRISLDDINFEIEARSQLSTYQWPGNVRELESTVISFMAKMRNLNVTANDLPKFFSDNAQLIQNINDLQTVELRTIQEALSLYRGHVAKAAKKLGISRATLYRKLQKYNLKSWPFMR